jgi:hypothetical protein
VMIWRLGWKGVLFSEAGVLISRCYRCKSGSTLDIEAEICMPVEETLVVLEFGVILSCRNR